MKLFNVHDAKTQLSRLLERAHAGEEVIIAKNGKPYARLCPLEPPQARKPGLLSGTVGDSFFDALPEEELEGWENEVPPRYACAALVALRRSEVVPPRAGHCC